MKKVNVIYHDDPVRVILTPEPISGLIETDGQKVFMMDRSQKIELKPKYWDEWPEFLGLLSRLFQDRSFLLDFHGPRRQMEVLLSEYNDQKAQLDISIDFLYNGVDVASLDSEKYKAKRLRTILRQARCGKYPTLEAPCFTAALEDFLSGDLHRKLTAPTADDRREIQSILDAGRHCLHEALYPISQQEPALLQARRMYKFCLERLSEQHRVLNRLHELEADTRRASDLSDVLHACMEQLDRLAGGAERDGMDQQLQDFMTHWLGHFAARFTAYGQGRIEAVQQIYQIGLWKTSVCLRDDYPVFSAHTPADADWNIESTDLLAEAKKCLMAAFEAHRMTVQRETAAFLECNSGYIRAISEDVVATESLMHAATAKAERMERESKQTLARLLPAEYILDELEIMLVGPACWRG